MKQPTFPPDLSKVEADSSLNWNKLTQQNKKAVQDINAPASKLALLYIVGVKIKHFFSATV